MATTAFRCSASTATRSKPSKREIAAGLRPYGIDIAAKGEVAVVANIGIGAGDADTISVIDLKLDPPRVVNTYTVGQTPEGIKMSPDGKFVAVTVMNGSNKPPASPFFNANSQLQVWARNGTQLTKTGELPIGRWCQGIAWSSNSKTLLVQCMVEEEITVVRFSGLGGRSLQKVGTIKTKGGPAGHPHRASRDTWRRGAGCRDEECRDKSIYIRPTARYAPLGGMADAAPGRQPSPSRAARDLLFAAAELIERDGGEARRRIVSAAELRTGRLAPVELLERLRPARAIRSPVWRSIGRCIMGVVNVTPDSFSDGGRYLAADAAIAHALQLEAEGADILDIGAEFDPARRGARGPRGGAAPRHARDRGAGAARAGAACRSTRARPR